MSYTPPAVTTASRHGTRWSDNYKPSKMRNGQLSQLNFQSWYQLYLYLERRELHGNEVVNFRPLVVYGDDDKDRLQFSLETIKANAFEELHASLPKLEALDIMHEAVLTSYQQGNRELEPVLHYLSKLKARYEPATF